MSLHRLKAPHRHPWPWLSTTLLSLAWLVPLSASEESEIPDQPPLVISAESAPHLSERVPGIASSDSADLLRHLPGISGSRLGGMGVDPIIRGQGEGGVQVLNNGTTIVSGCPNRMDPPTSYLNPALFDEIIVERGLRSLAHGLPTPGGSVRLNRQARIAGDGAEYLAGQVQSGWNSNDDGRHIQADVASGNGPWALRTLLSASEAGDYTDGNGDRVSAAHRTAQASVLGAWQATKDLLVETEAGISDHRDVRYPGAGMDSPQSTARFAHSDLSWTIGHELLRSTSLKMHYSEVDHVMDNFSLRNPPAMRMEAPSETMSIGVNWAMNLGSESVSSAGMWQLQWGIDSQHTGQDADLINRNTNAIVSAMWNDIQTTTIGSYAQGLYGLTDHLRIETAVRIDWWEMTRDPHPLAADDNALITYYGDHDDTMREWLPSAILGIQWDLATAWTLRGAASMAHRPATATEGFFMRRPGMAGMWHLGNPNLNPERHQMVDLSLSGSGKWGDWSWTTEGELFYDRVDDAIRQIRFAANQPIGYDHTDIDLMGVVWEGALTWQFNRDQQFVFSADASYTRGRNRHDDGMVARIAPASASLAIDWNSSGYGLGLWVRGAYRQHRVDTVRDAGPSSSWGIVGLKAHYDITSGLRLRGGIDNLFDRSYAEHLSRENVFDGTDALRVNEPGRSIWMAGEWSF